MSTYGISFAEDDAFAEGDDFALVVTAEGGWIFYRESTLGPEVLEDSWAAYRALFADPARRTVAGTLGGSPSLRVVV